MSKMQDDLMAWLKSFPSSAKWSNTIKSPKTLDIYNKNLAQYCKAVGKNPDELIAIKIKGLKAVNTPKEFQAEDLLDNFLYNTELTDNVKIAILAAVKSFYKANWRELNSNVGKNLTLPEPKKRTPKMNDIIELDDAMTSHRDRAVMWFLVSCPTREGTLTKLFWRDLKSTAQLLKETREEAKGQIKRTVAEDEELAKLVPYYIVVEAERMKGAGKGRYKGVKQIGFINYFAAQKLEQYKSEMKRMAINHTADSPIFVAYKNNYWNKGKGDRLKSVELIFHYGSIMAWNDPENKKFSAQDFRDVLQSACERVEANPNMVSPLLGHKVKGVDKHYSNHDIEELLLVYRKALPYLVPQTVEQVKAETQKKLEEEQKRIVNLEFENISLKGNINTINSQQQAQKEQIESMYQFVHKSLDPALDAFNKIVSTPEGDAIWRKIQQKELDAERERAKNEDENGEA